MSQFDQRTADFLSKYPSPWKDNQGKVRRPQDIKSLLEHYLSEVEEAFRYDFRGGNPYFLSDQELAKEDKEANYPRDWKWRSCAVKHQAEFYCVDCFDEGNNTIYEHWDLHAHHYLITARACRWETSDTDYSVTIPDGPHAFGNLGSVSNLICLCERHHSKDHGFELKKTTRQPLRKTTSIFCL
jgi:hypothetical protein